VSILAAFRNALKPRVEIVKRMSIARTEARNILRENG
jgi:hypothetical protein